MVRLATPDEKNYKENKRENRTEGKLDEAIAKREELDKKAFLLDVTRQLVVTKKIGKRVEYKD